MCMYPTQSFTGTYFACSSVACMHAYLDGFRLSGVDVCDSVIILLMERHSLDVVEGTQQVCLDGV